MSNVIALFRVPQLVIEEQPEHARDSGPHQMPLPFSAPAVIVQVMTQDFDSGSDFVDFINSVSPAFIVDMRISPRLDFICPSRTQTLDLFTSMRLSYRDILGRIGAKSYDDASHRRYEAIAVLNQLCEDAVSQPILAFFDDLTFLQNCSTAMQGRFEPLYMDHKEIDRAAADGARQQM